ncbi:hypothetical protein VUR80DRAFT_5172 [Thermomyces stellatus]
MLPHSLPAANACAAVLRLLLDLGRILRRVTGGCSLVDPGTFMSARKRVSQSACVQRSGVNSRMEGRRRIMRCPIEGLFEMMVYCTRDGSLLCVGRKEEMLEVRDPCLIIVDKSGSLDRKKLGRFPCRGVSTNRINSLIELLRHFIPFSSISEAAVVVQKYALRSRASAISSLTSRGRSWFADRGWTVSLYLTNREPIRQHDTSGGPTIRRR